MNKNNQPTGADIVVDILIQQNVKYVFSLPGAKIDAIYDILHDRGPKLIVTRHEQNAAFIAGAIGKITGKPGVVIVTSGPGVTNIVTGVATANLDSDPLIAIAGNVAQKELLKPTIQFVNNAVLFNSITKFSQEVVHQDNKAVTLINAFRIAQSGQKGPSFISIPTNILKAPVTDTNRITNKQFHIEENKNPDLKKIRQLIDHIAQAKLPVLFIGMRAAHSEIVKELHNIVQKHHFPVVETIEAAGCINRELQQHFYGRVGLFSNQPGDELLKAADLIITIGLNTIEYPPELWNKKQTPIITIDTILSNIDNFYQPLIEIIGDISLSLKIFNDNFPRLTIKEPEQTFLKSLQTKFNDSHEVKVNDKDKVHPLFLLKTLRDLIADTIIVICDAGSLFIWVARYFYSYNPKTLLMSNGMQTLGIGLPWAIAAALVKPETQVISMSGDAGFLLTSMELATAVELKLPIVHLIWNDGAFDMVACHQIMEHKRTTGTKLHDIDFVKYAESFGAVGLRVKTTDQLIPTLKRALTYKIPVIVDIAIDYRESINLWKTINQDFFQTSN